MRVLILGLLLIISTVTLAHRGDYIAITEVQITEKKDVYIYSFLIENIKQVPYSDVKIEFWVNSKAIQIKNYPLLDGKSKFIGEQFVIAKKNLNIDSDIVNIEITEIFGESKDWGGWDSDAHEKQVNTLYSEFYVDAPWRMKKLDDQGEIVPIPVHFFLHDADLVVGTKPQIDMIDIQLKNASDANFGPVLKFDSISAAQLGTYISCPGVADNDLNIQGFSMNSFSTSNSTTIDFDINSDFWNDYVEVNATYWFFTFNIPASVLAGMNNNVDILVTIHYGNFTFSDDQVGMRVFRSDFDVPKLPGYYRGDTHLHSMFTQNDAEIGLPLCATKRVGQLVGLDWITTTDHTSDFDNYGSSINSNWARIQADAQQMNTDDPSLIYIAGQEVALNNHDNKLVHMLAYPNMNDPYGLPFIGDGDGDVSSTSVSVNSALSALAAIDAFAYAAHPYATEDKLPLVPVDGGIWNLGEVGFPANGSNFPRTGGEIICNDPSASSDVLSVESGKLIKDALKGSQILNHRGTLESTGDELDGWDIDNGGGGFTISDTASTGRYLKKFSQGLEVVSYINQLGLALKNQDDSYKNWKMFFSAGSDAHGSFNYSNTGDFAGFGTIDDNAVGKLNTLVYCPEGMKADGSGILSALYHGRNILSDGPILAIGISDDGENNSNELLMGDDALVHVDSSGKYFINFDYTTNEEFGGITKMIFVLGTVDGEIEIPLPSNWDTTGTIHESLNLDNVLTSMFTTGVVPQDEYFYVRAYMETYRDLSAQSSEYRKSYDRRHAFTNPIWLKYIKPVAEVDQLTLSTRPNPFQNDFYLMIQTTEVMDVTVGIYDKLGKLIKNEIRYVPFEKEIHYTAAELGLANGTYTIRVIAGEEKESIQIVKY